MIKPTEKFNFGEPILNTTKLGLIRLSVYNSVFNVNRGNNQFLYASTVLDGDGDEDERKKPHALPEPLSSNSTLTLTLTLTQTLTLTITLTLPIHLSLIIIIRESNCYIQLLHRVHMN